MDKNTIDTLKEFLPDYVIDEICIVNGIDLGEKKEKIEIKKTENIGEFIKETEKKGSNEENVIGDEEYNNNNNNGKKEKKITVDNINDDSIQMYINEIEKTEKFSNDEEIDLLRKIKGGDQESRKKLTASNLRLVVSIAKEYMGRGLGLLDLVQKGNEGLFKAIDIFDININSNFSNFAKMIIEKEIITELNKNNSYTSIFDLIKNFTYINKFRAKTTTKEIRYGIIDEDSFDKIGKFPYFVFPVSISQISKLQDLLKDIETVFKGNDSKNFIPSFMQSGDDDENIFGIDEKINLLTILTINYLNNNGTQLIPENIIYHNLKLEKLTPELLKNPNFYKNFLINDTSNIETFIQSLDNKKTRFLKYYLIELSKNISDNKEALSKIYFLLNNYLKEVKAEKTNINIFQYKDLRNIFAIIKEIIEGDIKLKKVLLEKINDLYEIWLFQKMIRFFNENGEEKLKEKLYFITDNFEAKIKEDKKNNVFVINNNNVNTLYFQNKKDLLKGIIDKGEVINGIFDNKIFLDNFGKENKNNNGKIEESFKEINIDKKDYNKFYGIISSNKDKIEFIKKLGSKNIGKGFIKEDTPDFDGLSTIELDNLSNKNDKQYNISISLGGHFGGKDTKKSKLDENIISKKLASLITEKIDHLEDIIKTDKLTPDFVIKISENSKNIGNIILDAKFSKYPFFVGDNMDYAPVLKYYVELGKYLSTSQKYSKFPYKIIILFPGDKEVKELEDLNNYFQRNSNVVAVPLMVGDENILNKNLEYLEKYILEFIKEIEYKKKD